jgi:hypothetical protein
MTSEYGEFAKELRQQKQEKAQQRYQLNYADMIDAVSSKRLQIVREIGGGFRVRLPSSAAKFDIQVDYWPSTGTAVVVGDKSYRKQLTVGGLLAWLDELQINR